MGFGWKDDLYDDIRSTLALLVIRWLALVIILQGKAPFASVLWQVGIQMGLLWDY